MYFCCDRLFTYDLTRAITNIGGKYMLLGKIDKFKGDREVILLIGAADEYKRLSVLFSKYLQSELKQFEISDVSFLSLRTPLRLVIMKHQVEKQLDYQIALHGSKFLELLISLADTEDGHHVIDLCFSDVQLILSQGEYSDSVFK